MDSGKRGGTVWLTGLPSSGKSTIAYALASRIELDGGHVEVLDGDVLRRALGGVGYSRAGRDLQVARTAWLCSLLSRHGIVSIVALISPYRGARAAARKLLTDFVEIYVQCPLETCVERDVKGLYDRAVRGFISGMTGVDDPYEEPNDPEVVVPTHKQSVDESVATIYHVLSRRGWFGNGKKA
jgi:adenylyl-sulfate kinase